MRATATFLQHSSEGDKAGALRECLARVRRGEPDTHVFLVDPRSFRQVPGAPFAYWVGERVRRLFATLAPFEDGDRYARVGASTKDDFRFVRAWWAVPPALLAQSREGTLAGRRWVAYTKGGVSAPYYSRLSLVLDWADDGRELKEYVASYRGDRGWGYHWTAGLNGYEDYFKPGLSWAVRTRRFSPHAVPAGCIFSGSRYQAFVPAPDLLWVLGLLNGMPCTVLLRMCSERQDHPKFMVGIVARLPFPCTDARQRGRLGAIAREGWSILYRRDTADETSRAFVAPAFSGGLVLSAARERWVACECAAEQRLDTCQRELEVIACEAYGLRPADLLNPGPAAEGGSVDAPTPAPAEHDADEDDLDPPDDLGRTPAALVSGLLSYSLGAAFGRWDIRFATGEREAPPLPDPFAPLPACPPGMLQGEDGLPMTETPDGYPLRIDWDGILADDPEHADDMIRRVRDVLTVIWDEKADGIEQEACEILGIKGLRDYFRKTGSGGFWDDHVKRYSKSRRKAPIYWYLRSSKGNYGLWLYYHRLDPDILYKALVNYAEPRLRLEDNRLRRLAGRKEAAGTSGAEAKRLERELDRQETLVSEVADFRDKLRRAADLRLEPDLNDGVVLTIAPLWELVPWKVARQYWDELMDGKYEWSTIGKQLRAKGLVSAE